MTVFVIAGGLSHERDVSLRSGARVATALRDRGLAVEVVDVNQELIARLQADDDPVAVPVLHGGLGEDGALREVLRVLGVPFVGSGGAASRRTFDKSIATRLVAGAGIPTPQQVALPDDIFRELGAQAIMAALGERLHFPLMVKPARSGSALGAVRVSAAEELPQALVGAFAYGKMAVVEEFIDGVELAVTVVDGAEGPRALPPVEIRPAGGVYDYEARYTAGATRFVTPGELPEAVLEQAGEVAVRVHELLGLRDLSRTDLIVRDGVAHFIEGNVAPGLTETSLVPLALEAAGLSLGEVVEDLIDKARSRLG
ncbi:D-alanine--D-alanine ligase [Arachnia propionica]|uniref:D-alanine--D-alanine ligase n=1 Tax=Arachnia propionica TaxID=1750 RepID=A0A3P1T696_9ACTN|nr:D-alanine--D-alanine ligase [Arachnia propionica]MDO5083370.1 D-alanine--D-alanine ligase [Arachnia propionica]RRD04715.1 D-alanine--D-alanine ligase [Arachnia propionica]